ncbi:outer membrane protein assembly factor BamE [Crateriforma spongiae]|uniref:outer membrane protein assembly factor BamE n=1 Tax=Crateriforma spongiae TaxID=2724528 RepID=UPI0014453C41|nr:outer membrane protein assembly factor BamE [Crateriforma spongiae]
MRFAILLIATSILASYGNATDRSFDDISAQSPNGVWRLDAKSPDNRIDGYHPWQDDFVYTMHKGGRRVWSREQNKQEPEEYSPTRIVVADDGWTAIHTGWDQLVFVDANGRNCGRIDDLKELLSKKDRSEFTTWSTAGVIWTPYSLWHFAIIDGKRIFVIRLWWGHQLIFDPENGHRLKMTPSYAKPIRDLQVDHCRKVLANAVADGINDDSADNLLTPALLAGQLDIRDAIPHLRELEKSEFVGLYGGSMATDIEPGAINPFFIQQFTLRQVSQLSLRRLGESPKTLPVFEFPKHRASGNLRPERQNDRAKQIVSVKNGMSAEDVLKILGSPDFIDYSEWSYDLDGDDPKTATITWDSYEVKSINVTKPLWRDGLSRDRLVVGY